MNRGNQWTLSIQKKCRAIGQEKLIPQEDRFADGFSFHAAGQA